MPPYDSLNPSSKNDNLVGSFIIASLIILSTSDMTFLVVYFLISTTGSSFGMDSGYIDCSSIESFKEGLLMFDCEFIIWQP